MANSSDRTAFRFAAPQGAGVVDFIGASVPLDYYNLDRGIDRVISALGVIYRSP